MHNQHSLIKLAYVKVLVKSNHCSSPEYRSSLSIELDFVYVKFAYLKCSVMWF